ncbi:MAG: hypothetical protein R2690_10850 [Acidimicrobiales bacterium]
MADRADDAHGQQPQRHGGQTVANLVLATVGAGGEVSIFNNSGAAHVVVDVVGWVDRDLSGSRYTSLSPARIVDSRDGTGGAATPFGAAEARDIQVTGVGGVPVSGVTAVVVNVTVTAPTDATHLTVWPAGQAYRRRRTSTRPPVRRCRTSWWRRWARAARSRSSTTPGRRT